MLKGLEAAWAFYERMPCYLALDNIPAALAGADRLHPHLTRGFLEYVQQRSLIADLARVRRPHDKPRVERRVPSVRERFFKGAQFRELAEIRAGARRWALEVAGQRIHGTTRRRPLAIFEQEESSTLAAWDGEPGEPIDGRTAKVHPEHQVACQNALYSVPLARSPPGQRVEVRLVAPCSSQGQADWSTSTSAAS